MDQDVLDGIVFFLHLLMVAPALIGPSRLDEIGHHFEHFGRSPVVLVLKMLPVLLHELQVEQLLVIGPPSNLEIIDSILVLANLRRALGGEVAL